MNIRNRRFYLSCILGLMLLGSGLVHPSGEQHPLDAVFRSSVGTTERADELTILRRLSLQLRGMPPSVAEIRQFEALPREERIRTMAIRYLKDPAFAQYWATHFGSALREQTNMRRSKYGSYYDYISQSLQANKPYNEIVSELILAEGTPDRNGASNFYLRDDGDPLQVAEYVGRVFYGSRMACARCHDHPFDPNFTRRDYYGFAAFFSQVWVRQNHDFEFINNDRMEHLPTEARREYEEERRRWQQTVWNPMNEAQRRAYREQHKLEFAQVVYEPRLELRFPHTDDAPGGDLVRPRFPDGTEAVLDDGADRRRALVRWLTGRRNDRFRKVIVNRIYYELMGYGFFEPLDDWNSNTELRDPAILEHLDRVFLDGDYRIKNLILYIVSSDAYARRAPGAASASRERDDLYFQPHRMDASQLLNTMLRASGQATVGHVWERSLANLNPGAGTPDLSGVGEILKPRQDMRDLANAVEVPRPAHSNTFLAVFGAGERTDVDDDSGEPTIDQVLTLLNGRVTAQIVRSAAAEGSWLRTEFANHQDMLRTIDAIYLSMLGRHPSEVELTELQNMISTRFQPGAAGFNEGLVQDLIWSMIQSQEFIHVY